jgi:hypothetical protein
LTAAVALMLFWAGKLQEASENWSAASKALTDANNAVLDAIGIVQSNCSREDANACLSTPDPCG